MRKNKTSFSRTVFTAAIVFLTGAGLGALQPGCIPTPTQAECFKQTDCRECTIAFCAWCGSRPGVRATGKGCYAKNNKPLDCEEPPHVAYCYQDSTTPIDNRMYLKKPDGGADAGQDLTDR